MEGSGRRMERKTCKGGTAVHRQPEEIAERRARRLRQIRVKGQGRGAEDCAEAGGAQRAVQRGIQPRIGADGGGGPQGRRRMAQGKQRGGDRRSPGRFGARLQARRGREPRDTETSQQSENRFRKEEVKKQEKERQQNEKNKILCKIFSFRARRIARLPVGPGNGGKV